MPTKINFVGSSLAECILVRGDFFLHKKMISGKRESLSYVAIFDENRRAVGMNAEPYARRKCRHAPGGRRDDTCDHGLSRRTLRVKPPIIG